MCDAGHPKLILDLSDASLCRRRGRSSAKQRAKFEEGLGKIIRCWTV